jgi:hypothetical protein
VPLTTLKTAGSDAVRLLNEHRARYAATGQYPFLIGDSHSLEMLEEIGKLNGDGPFEILSTSLKVDLEDWIVRRKDEGEEYYDEYPLDEILGEWPGEIGNKGSMSLHKDLLTGKIKPDVYLGLAQIELPWHLPAALEYGGWNACPDAAVHCAFHRQWHERFGAEITGMSGDIIECLVRNPPSDRDAAIELAWEQYWYCQDIVDQGCRSILNLAATLLNSPYWYFWWD